MAIGILKQTLPLFLWDSWHLITTSKTSFSFHTSWTIAWATSFILMLELSIFLYQIFLSTIWRKMDKFPFCDWVFAGHDFFSLNFWNSCRSFLAWYVQTQHQLTISEMAFRIPLQKPLYKCSWGTRNILSMLRTASTSTSMRWPSTCTKLGRPMLAFQKIIDRL